jgi:hypothetical protein
MPPSYDWARACKYLSRRHKNSGSEQDMPIANTSSICQSKPGILSLRDSAMMNNDAEAAVTSKSHENPEITHEANGADQNCGQASSRPDPK